MNGGGVVVGVARSGEGGVQLEHQMSHSCDNVFTVMRLTRPSMYTNVPVTCEPQDLPGKVTLSLMMRYKIHVIDVDTAWFSPKGETLVAGVVCFPYTHW